VRRLGKHWPGTTWHVVDARRAASECHSLSDHYMARVSFRPSARQSQVEPPHRFSGAIFRR
jgi:hypothetical protein